MGPSYATAPPELRASMPTEVLEVTWERAPCRESRMSPGGCDHRNGLLDLLPQLLLGSKEAEDLVGAQLQHHAGDLACQVRAVSRREGVEPLTEVLLLGVGRQCGQGLLAECQRKRPELGQQARLRAGVHERLLQQRPACWQGRRQMRDARHGRTHGTQGHCGGQGVCSQGLGRQQRRACKQPCLRWPTGQGLAERRPGGHASKGGGRLRSVEVRRQHARLQAEAGTDASEAAAPEASEAARPAAAFEALAPAAASAAPSAFASVSPVASQALLRTLGTLAPPLSWADVERRAVHHAEVDFGHRPRRLLLGIVHDEAQAAALAVRLVGPHFGLQHVAVWRE
mmetsp:Transcript_117402/g.378899  ORF Transcript_117402/g.378899 Transcript_117402/m.378899 type:complete len:341 (-) Transcript_117402:1110-2132(-)